MLSIVHRFKSILDVLSMLSVIAIALIMFWQFVIWPHTVAQAARAESVVSDEIAGAALTKRIGTAPVVLIEFADFQCPYCAEVATTLLPRVKRELVDAGVLSFAYLHYPLQKIHRNAFPASEAAECAGKQNRYWEMHARLSENPSRLSTKDLLKHAGAIGLETTDFASCLGGQAASLVHADIKEANRLGVRGTPAFFLGRASDGDRIRLVRRFNGVVTFETIRDAIAQMQPQRAWSWRRLISGS
jgi:protein-disulfide isomerase